MCEGDGELNDEDNCSTVTEPPRRDLGIRMQGVVWDVHDTLYSVYEVADVFRTECVLDEMPVCEDSCANEGNCFGEGDHASGNCIDCCCLEGEGDGLPECQGEPVPEAPCPKVWEYLDMVPLEPEECLNDSRLDGAKVTFNDNGTDQYLVLTGEWQYYNSCHNAPYEEGLICEADGEANDLDNCSMSTGPPRRELGGGFFDRLYDVADTTNGDYR
eukprot:UN03024